MTEAVGAELQRAREALGLSVAEVAQHLKFAPRQLEALEQERFDELPGGTFVRGMVRSYARLVRLAPQPLLEALAGRFDAPDAGQLAARYSQPVPFSNSGRRSTFVYLGLSLGVLALGGGFAFQWYREHNAAVQLASAKAAPPAPARPAAAAAKPAAASAPKAHPKSVEPAPQVEAATRVSAPKEIVAKTSSQAPAKAAPAVASAESAAPPASPAAAPAKTAGAVHRLVIRCDEEAWIEVRDSNERMLVSSLNPKGCERVVQARGPLSLVIGNAEHVQVLHNGRALDLTPHTKLAIARFTLQ